MSTQFNASREGRGISAVDEALRSGPVRVVSRNRPRYVILSEQRNQELIGPASAASRRWDRLLTDPAQGTREADDILGQVRGERLSWDW